MINKNWAVLTVLTIVCVAACTPGAAQPTPPTATSGPHTDPTTPTAQSTAPPVSKPLDASTMIAAPCTALTGANVRSLHIVNASAHSAASSGAPTACVWSGDGGGGISIGWQTANPHGLSDLYAKAATIAYWQPTTVAGYPAAYGDTISDGRSQGDCVLDTAVSDQTYFISQFDNPLDPNHACILAEQAAQDVIANLQGAS